MADFRSKEKIEQDLPFGQAGSPLTRRQDQDFSSNPAAASAAILPALLAPILLLLPSTKLIEKSA